MCGEVDSQMRTAAEVGMSQTGDGEGRTDGEGSPLLNKFPLGGGCAVDHEQRGAQARPYSCW